MNEDAPYKVGGRRVTRLKTHAIIGAIGEVITLGAPMLEAITEPAVGDVFSTTLSRWAPRLTRLRSLQLWDGKALGNETTRNLLYAHCPMLELLSLYQWQHADADHHLAEFISGLQPNKLVAFENLSVAGIGAETCVALNAHGKSLNSLKLLLTNDGLPALGLLQGCTALESLELTDMLGSTNLEETENETFLDIVTWLRNCHGLRELALTNFKSAPAMLTAAFMERAFQLEKLQIKASAGSAYVVAENQDFHVALAEQQGLHSLFLSADPDPPTRDDIEILCSSLFALKDLRELKFTRIADYFSDTEIIRIAQNLTNLEDIYIGGTRVTDRIWDSVAGLKNLKSITLSAITRFTVGGLLGFIEKLGPGNRGLVVSVDFGDPDQALSEDEQTLIRDRLADTVGGRFEYILLRDPDASDYESGDSD
ncbi:hypothetical protein LTR50_000639 [Elasticomyces elasticus]|nr:hypothetical protein LTR50_000639 [Elasticomyces elasticus]